MSSSLARIWHSDFSHVTVSKSGMVNRLHPSDFPEIKIRWTDWRQPMAMVTSFPSCVTKWFPDDQNKDTVLLLERLYDLVFLLLIFQN